MQQQLMKSPFVLHKFALLLWYLIKPLNFLTILSEYIAFSCIAATEGSSHKCKEAW